MEKNTAEKKARLAWKIEADKMVCTFPENTGELVVKFTDIVGYTQITNEIQHGLMVHGLKQKLADCIAGMKDEEWTERMDAMEDKWVEIATGTAKTRANANPKKSVKEIHAAIDEMDIPQAMKDMMKAKF